mmetsp:Transcript_32045/g.66317  ORF Transcript_32045/g.66317 Transcript_32045/m.66317 type:complete len:282 (-) Transcript_32045:409-1254(-)
MTPPVASVASFVSRASLSASSVSDTTLSDSDATTFTWVTTSMPRLSSSSPALRRFLGTSHSCPSQKAQVLPPIGTTTLASHEKCSLMETRLRRRIGVTDTMLTSSTGTRVATATPSRYLSCSSSSNASTLANWRLVENLSSTFSSQRPSGHATHSALLSNSHCFAIYSPSEHSEHFWHLPLASWKLLAGSHKNGSSASAKAGSGLAPQVRSRTGQLSSSFSERRNSSWIAARGSQMAQHPALWKQVANESMFSAAPSQCSEVPCCAATRHLESLSPSHPEV